MSSEKKDEALTDGWFASLVGAQLDALYLHVRLMYPFADTESTVLEVFGRARSAKDTPSIGPRAWLRRIARQVAVPNGDQLAAQRNADAAAFGLRDVIDLVAFDGVRVDLERLVDGLNELSLDEQELLRLSSIEDLDPVELAWILELDEHRLSLKLATARDRLRAACAGSVDDEGRSGWR